MGPRNSNHGSIYFFHDPEFESEHKATLIRQVQNGRMDRETSEEMKDRAGIIGQVTDLDRDGSGELRAVQRSSGC